MKKLALLLAFGFVLSCAPLLCKPDQALLLNHLEDQAPEKYTSQLLISYGILKVPVKVEKDKDKYRVESARFGRFSFDKKGLCLNSVCIDLPFSIDGIIFGKTLTGEEKPSCTSKGLVLGRDAGAYLVKHYFVNNQLAKVEVLDKKRDRIITLIYGQKAPEGYYRRIKVNWEDFTFTINVEEVKF
ncbi:hypothetical protein [Thermocrinis sp.]|jgi:hypothetical protein|uniref:hypothetical protein n=1 Tax=Thermocrinis sp. TaxID=2024383 RepID=UPI003C106017